MQRRRLGSATNEGGKEFLPPTTTAASSPTTTTATTASTSSHITTSAATPTSATTSAAAAGGMRLVPQLALTSAKRSFHAALIIIYETWPSTDNKSVWLGRAVDGGVGTLGVLELHISKALRLASGVVASHSDAALNNLSTGNEGIVYGGLIGIVWQIPNKDDAAIIWLITGLAPSCIGLHHGRRGARSGSIRFLYGNVSFAQVQSIQFFHSLGLGLGRIKHNMAKSSQSTSVLPSAKKLIG